MSETLLRTPETLIAVEEQGALALELDSVSEMIADDGPVQGQRIPSCPVPWRHPIRAAIWVGQVLFGLVSLLVLLALLAAIPIVNLVALGYLLEVEGRVGRSGQVREAFPLLHLAPRFGSIILGIWLWLIPLRLIAGAAGDARLIDAGSPSDTGLHLLLNAMWICVTIHLCLALARGGSLSCFFRPVKNVRWLRQRVRAGDYLETASKHIRNFVTGLKIKHHFWLGLRGLIGGMAWLMIPTAIFVAMANTEDSEGPHLLVTIIGGTFLGLTLSWMPFLQARFATEQKLRVMFHLRTVRGLFKHAPLAWLMATALVYVSALPLYLLKVALLPQDASWLITVIFIASIYPAKVVAGWAYHRAVKRKEAGETSSRVWSWLARVGMVPLLAAYVIVLYFTQFIGAHGTAGLFEHHAFLLPWPGVPG